MNLPVKLLARGLQGHGDQLAIGRLYDWLDLGFTEESGRTSRSATRKTSSRYARGLDQRPEHL